LKKLNNIICECELVTQEVVEQAIHKIGTKFIGDIQHRTRLGMGPCQGGFCTFRALGLMLQNGKIDSTESIKILKKFLNNRYKGIRPVLWGDQLREQQLIEGIYL
jgi:glycerol-3-phosphate dehydrogenase